ncbi:hypothetical protein M514_00820 [Trichuris suis]|uniref:DUF4371 domain-containing protein n=1 Tax=Trichuris suis TaxID=68888 RepID=A0A085N090_9BILA|nr:hypothetical protein M514_00820 [Trichuris suis]
MKHLISVHPEKKDKPFEFFQKLRDTFQKRATLTHMVHERPQRLDNGIVSSRIDEMAGDTEEQLICLLKSRRFSLQLDETTLQDNDCLLMAYVRFFSASELVEMLLARRIRTDTKGATTFEEIRDYFEQNGIPMENIIACATDDAASMVGRYRGFISYLKAVVPSVFTIHCIAHREHLVVNFIKSHALQNRLFRQLCEENGEDFDTLLLHTEVRSVFLIGGAERFQGAVDAKGGSWGAVRRWGDGEGPGGTEGLGRQYARLGVGAATVLN